jgi:hypothetical protein
MIRHGALTLHVDPETTFERAMTRIIGKRALNAAFSPEGDVIH